MMDKQDAEFTLKAIEALQEVGAEITLRLMEIDRMMISAGELLTVFKTQLEDTLRDLEK